MSFMFPLAVCVCVCNWMFCFVCVFLCMFYLNQTKLQHNVPQFLCIQYLVSVCVSWIARWLVCESVLHTFQRAPAKRREESLFFVSTNNNFAFKRNSLRADLSVDSKHRWLREEENTSVASAARPGSRLWQWRSVSRLNHSDASELSVFSL